MEYTFTVSTILFLLVGFWLFARYLFKQKIFLDKSRAEQQKIKRKIYWSVYGGLTIGAVSMLLVQHGITFWLPYLVMFFYLLIWVGGIYLLWLAYRIGVCKESARIKRRNGESYKLPSNYLHKFSILNLISGIAVLLIAIGIPLLRMDIKIWGILLGMVLAARNYIGGLFDKSDSSSEV